MNLGDLIIRIIVEDGKAKAQVVGFESAVKKSGKKVEQQNERTKLSFKSIGDFAQRAYFTIQSGAIALRALNNLSNAANELEKAERRLEGASKLTGVSLEKMKVDAAAAKEELGLTTKQSNLIVESLTKLGAKSGDITKTQEATKRLLDLAAARGYDAEAALVAIDQAILGIDEGTDKLFGKNPSVIYAEYANQIGTTAGKLDDQQKAQALLNAVLSDGLKVQGSYQDFLNSSAGKQALATAKVEEASAKFGQLYNEMKNIFYDLVAPVASFFASMDVGLLKMITILVATIALLVKLPAILGGISVALKAVGISAQIATGPIGWIVAAIGVLAAVWASNLGGIQEKTKAVFGFVADVFRKLWTTIKSVFTSIFDFLKPVFTVYFAPLITAVRKLREIWNSIFGGIKEKTKAVFGGIADVFRKLWTTIKPVFDAIINLFKTLVIGYFTLLITAVRKLREMWESNFGGIQDKTKAVFGAIADVFRKLWTTIKPVFAAIIDLSKTAFQYISATFAAIGEVIQVVIERIVARFSGLAKIISSVFKGDFEGVKQGAKEVADSYVGGFGDAVNRVKDKFNASLNDLKKAKDEKKEEFENDPIIIETKITSTGSGASPSTGSGASTGDPAAAEEARKKLAELRLANIANEYVRQREIVKAAYDDEATKYAGNMEVLAELRIKAKNDLAAIDKDYADKQQKEAEEELKKEQKRAEELTKLKLDAIGDEFAQQRAALDVWLSEEQIKWAGNAEALIALETIKQQRLEEIENESRERKRQADDQTWKEFAERYEIVLSTASAAYNTFWGSLLESDINGKDRAQQVWEAMRSAFASSLAKRVKEFAAARLKELIIERQTTAAQQALSAKGQAADVVGLAKVIGQNIAAMASRLFAGLAKLGPLGFLVGIGGVVAAIAAVKGIIRGLRGFATGGIVEKPEIILAGENGPEIIAPQKDFMAVMKSMQIQGLRAATAGGGENLSRRFDRLEEAISKMQFSFSVDGRELSTAVGKGNEYRLRNFI